VAGREAGHVIELVGLDMVIWGLLIALVAYWRLRARLGR
jgi:hypothetical protein